MTITVDPVVEEGKLMRSNRIMHFRDTNGTVDCGGRFANIPEQKKLGAEEYMEAFKEGVKGQFLKPRTEKEINKMQKEEVAEKETRATEYIEQSQLDKSALLAEVVQSYQGGTDEQKEEAKGKLKEFGISNFKDPEAFSKEQFDAMLAVFK